LRSAEEEEEEKKEEEEMQQCLPSFIGVKLNVATNLLSTDLTYLGLHVRYPILLSVFHQI
jgi:hypothetical protein